MHPPSFHNEPVIVLWQFSNRDVVVSYKDVVNAVYLVMDFRFQFIHHVYLRHRFLVILYVKLANEWYIHDTSCKIKSVLHAKGIESKRLTSNAIYRYKKDPEDNSHWIIDEEAAAVVRRIYQLILEGNEPKQVARILTNEKVERPSYYLAKQGLGTCQGSCDMGRPYTWTATTISDMLKKPEYTGHTVNFRHIKIPTKTNVPEKSIQKTGFSSKIHRNSLWIKTHGTPSRKSARRSISRLSGEKQTH